MVIGVLKEIKNQEYRVGLVPAGARALVEAGATVIVQSGAGDGAGLRDEMYQKGGAKIVSSPEQVWKESDLIVKVKELLPEEFPFVQKNQTIYTFLHMAVLPEMADLLLDKKATSISYDTIQRPDGSLPLLKPMSEVAGKMAVQIGATYLQRENGGKGLLLGGVPGVRHGKITIIGAGNAGKTACMVAIGMGADVTVIDVNTDRLEHLHDSFGNGVTTLKSHSQNIEDSVIESDVVIGSVLIPGAKAPRLVTRSMVSKMEKGSVIIDVAIDQGGCVETCKPTTHDNPTYVVDGVIHYCVTNMPGAVSRTSTFALTNATLPYLKKLVELGVKKAVANDSALALGVNTYAGEVTHPAVAQALNKPHKALEKLLS